MEGIPIGLHSTPDEDLNFIDPHFEVQSTLPTPSSTAPVTALTTLSSGIT